MERINKLVFGSLHKFSSWTYRRFSIDNYSWSVIMFILAALASFYMYHVTTTIIAVESNPDIAQMRTTSASIAIIGFVVFAGFILFSRKDLRKIAMRHYDMGYPLSLGVSMIAWAPVIFYSVTLPFSLWPGQPDVLLSGFALMFLFSEPPPMETRMNKAFSKKAAPV